MVDVSALWAQLAPDDAGLVAAVVQDDTTSEVLMVGYMNEDALRATFERGRVCFWSRSRRTLWEKGETSGHSLELRSVRVDCDGDVVLVHAVPRGPTCHEGTRSCFARRVTQVDPLEVARDEGPGPAAEAVLSRVFGVILDRQAGRGMTQAEGKSYVRRLLDEGAPKIGAKLREEAEELAVALAEESEDRVASEAADLVFHAMVGLALRGVDLRDVAQVFAARFGISGLDEKASRPPTE